MDKTIVKLRQGYIWNTVAGLINAAEAVIMSMIVTRVTGLTDAGILSIAFAIGNLLMLVGKFGLRNYQITDIENQFSFSIYLKTRLITVILMMVCSCAYLGYAAMHLGYSRNKIEIIFVVCMIYAVEDVEDVIWGYYQQRNRLEVGAQMFCARWTGMLIIFPIVLIASHDLKITLLFCFAISLLIFFPLAKMTYPRICSEADRNVNAAIRKTDLGTIGRLLKTALPLCGISVLQYYVSNAPKYAIDACLTDEIQACYGFVAMPVFVIRLLNSFIYQPLLVPMAVEWEQKQKKEFIKRIVKQTFIIMGISVICLLGAYVLGIPVLSLLYDTDLSEYKAELMILLLGSGFMASVGYQSVVLIVMRCQKELLWPYCLVSLIAAVSLNTIVSSYGTLGASICYLILMVLLCLMYTGILVRRLRAA